MITNEFQYRTTRIQAQKFRDAISQFDVAGRKKAGIDADLIDAELNGIKSQLETLEQEIADYESLKSLTFPVTESGIRELLVPLIGDRMWKVRTVLMVTPVILALCELRDRGEIRLDTRIIRGFLDMGNGFDRKKLGNRKITEIGEVPDAAWKDIRTHSGMLGLYLRAINGDFSDATKRSLKRYFDHLPGFSLKNALNGGYQIMKTMEHHGLMVMQATGYLESISHHLNHLLKNPCVIEIESVGDLGYGLIKARIASGLSQKGLAKRLGLKEQQIQRYEAECYSSAGFSRLVEISKALRIKFNTGFILPSQDVGKEIPDET